MSIGSDGQFHRAEILQNAYLSTIGELSRSTKLPKSKIGTKALAQFIRFVVDECDTLTLKATQELYTIAEELDVTVGALKKFAAEGKLTVPVNIDPAITG